MKIEARIELRKAVWQAVRNSPDAAINVTDRDIRENRQGLVVYLDERHLYCDGRSEPEVLGLIGKRTIVFLPFVPQADDECKVHSQPSALVAVPS